MRKNPFPIIVLLSLCAAYLIFIFMSAPLLPERMATHFGGNGEANGWMDRSTDLIFIATLGIGLPLLFVVLSLLIGLIPARFVNLPHRDYWLAPERRAETLAYISNQMIWMGCLLVLFMAGIHWLMIQANRMTPPHLPMVPFLILFGAFLAGIMIWSIAFIWHFRKPSEPDANKRW